MIISSEQLNAAKRGEAVRLTADDVELVVVRADIFDRATEMRDDRDDWTDSELRSLAARTFEDADAAGPIK